MCYKRQKQGGFFLNLTPKESHEFLIQCLDLSQYQNKIYKLNDLLKEQYKPKKIELESSLAELEKTIKEMEEYLAQKKEPVPIEVVNTEELKLKLQVFNQGIELLKKNRQQSLDDLGEKPVIQDSEEKQEIKSKIKNVDSHISELKQDMHNNIIEKEKSIQQMSTAINKIENKISEGNRIKDSILKEEEQKTKLQEQLLHIENGQCPTCMQEWKSKDKLEELKQSIINIDNDIARQRQYLTEMPHYMMMMEKAKTMIKEKKDEQINEEETVKLGKLEAMKEALSQELSDVDKNVLLEINKYTQDKNLIKSNYTEKSNKINQQIL
jgi:hypothetical protein